jgi:hypothetical protein
MEKKVLYHVNHFELEKEMDDLLKSNKIIQVIQTTDWYDDDLNRKPRSTFIILYDPIITL